MQVKRPTGGSVAPAAAHPRKAPAAPAIRARAARGARLANAFEQPSGKEGASAIPAAPAAGPAHPTFEFARDYEVRAVLEVPEIAQRFVNRYLDSEAPFFAAMHDPDS